MNELHCFTRESVNRPATGDGVLSGLTFALKDLCAVQGHTSSFGHAQWRQTHAPAKADASVLTTLLSAGAKLAGTTKMDQLAYSIIGNVGEDEAPVNTNYPERFCGGSSSGSAAAVAGGVVDFAVGSDTGGSVRIPAAVCGIYGVRTTHGLISKDGVIPLAPSADVLGFFARSAELLRLVTGLFTLPESKTIFKRLLLPSNLEDFTSLDVVALRQEAVRLAKTNELTLEEVDISQFVSPEAKVILAHNQGREIWRIHGEWMGDNKNYLAADVQSRLEACQQLADDDAAIIQADEASFRAYKDDLRRFIGTDAVLCLPILPISGPNRDWSEEQFQDFRAGASMLMAPSSISGLPQLSVPIVGATTNIGLLGPANSDLQLIDLIC